jgi:hypothetical protein
MARDFLAVSGTGVPIERFFSSGPDLLSPRRKSMKGATTRICMRLRPWLKSKNQEEFRKNTVYGLITKMLATK